MAKVVYDHVTKQYEGVLAVNNLNLDVTDGEFLVLVGPSGCGKSTALRCLAGLEEITAGDIYIGDRIVTNVPPKDRDIAMVFQNYALYPHMTVRDNLAFGLKLRHTPKNQINKRVEDVAEILGIEMLLDRKPKQLSGGQRQRVALGRAIVREPQVFLMDEPLSNLDAKLRVQTRAEIKKLHARLQTTTIYVTHDQVEAMTMGDRIVVMKDGVVQQVDTPLNLYEKPANLFVAGFIGSPAMNFVEVKLAKQDGKIIVDGGVFHAEVPPEYVPKLADWVGRSVIFGIRPEDIYDRAFSPISDGAVLRATVDVHEPLGSDVILYLSAGDHSIVARVDARTQARMGQAAEVVMDMKKMHVFNPETHMAIL